MLKNSPATHDLESSLALDQLSIGKAVQPMECQTFDLGNLFRRRLTNNAHPFSSAFALLADQGFQGFAGGVNARPVTKESDPTMGLYFQL
mmetsp:Transcript_96995/g.244573  ORF Transcript_96995/g.244573 Transcript_96995/m.244573 type:complete len:90 (-) Transcript_96995:184-453(-)